MKSLRHRTFGILACSTLAGLAAAPSLASAPTLDDLASQLGIPAEVAAVARYTHLAPPAEEGPGRGTIGPDVIVSQVGGSMIRYGTNGQITGYAFTTVSCNIGDQLAEWFANVARHPLIAQNLYRYKVVDGAGRIEQIGMAWLKHGWCAADAGGSGCGTCPVPGSGCNWLGINCSDTYGASLNGDQADLGPRSEVNAATAAYPYPYVRAWNQTGDALFKRLQVHNSDLDPAQNPGAQYFAEAQYICTDEAPHGTQYNNSSWRPVAVGSYTQGWNLGFTGATVQQEPALRAWKSVDPAVSIQEVYVPDDGMFVIGSRATDLGDGRWHYEFAILNYNSDRSAGSVSIPVPDGVQVSGIGFHDVDYHSGEPYSGDDWAASHDNGALTWSTQTYAENVNANALRWSTMYNFRFVADQPPTTGEIQIGLFKPGAGSSVSFTGPVPSEPPATCAGDFNGDGSLDVADFTAFRAAYLAGDTAADYSGDGSLGVEDFVAFRAAYLAGCP